MTFLVLIREAQLDIIIKIVIVSIHIPKTSKTGIGEKYLIHDLSHQYHKHVTLYVI